MATQQGNTINDIWAEAERIFYRKINQTPGDIRISRRSLISAVAELKEGPPDAVKDQDGRYKKPINSKKSATAIDSTAIISRMELMLEFGDKMMVAAPEIVSLVWMGLSAIGRVSRFAS